MPVVVELVHAEPGRRVVLARLMDRDTALATALGEGASAEEAEDRARARLQGLAQPHQQQPGPMPIAARTAESRSAAVRPAASSPAAAKPSDAIPTAQERAAEPMRDLQIELQTQQQIKPQTEQQAEQTSEEPIEPQGLAQREPEAPQEPPADPEDWSSELASLDLQLKRLGWGREQEAVYLLRAFGHGSRSRLTTYGDLVAYLRALESFAAGADPASCSIPLKRSDLLSQSDQLLAQLGWDAARGRQLLESHFGRNSRQQLSDAQLLEFNMLLESEVLAVT